ncbi:unnamed protein product [Protopolystoma xenopodis]|uniref:Uncharacterized protein n=1 Tax=Protopolystoma xenopodis TaxID=117903 RepID=A0A448WER1_9PLAT|nr:unnamed protein product [Protopolystoma xenopodis]
MSCAALVDHANVPLPPSTRDIWICMSDGFTGHLCLLNMQPEPMVGMNIPLAGCNSRITCICSVPSNAVGVSRRTSHNAFGHPGIHPPARQSGNCVAMAEASGSINRLTVSTAGKRSRKNLAKSQGKQDSFKLRPGDKKFPFIRKQADCEREAEEDERAYLEREKQEAQNLVPQTVEDEEGDEKGEKYQPACMQLANVATCEVRL